MFHYQIDWDSFKTRLIAQLYNLRNAFCKTILSLYSYFDPKSFKDGRDIDTTNSFSGYYKNIIYITSSLENILRRCSMWHAIEEIALSTSHF